jgi:phosphohistidine phosphatase
MRLYLVQHGKAMSKGEDPRRPLTNEGRHEAGKVARFIAPLNLEIGELWHSGKPRAEQTAAIYANVVAADTGPTAREGLAPDDDAALLCDELTAASDDVMIVGHMPFLAKLAALLLTGHESPLAVAFRNAGIVCLGRTEDSRWQLEWAVTPDLLPE